MKIIAVFVSNNGVINRTMGGPRGPCRLLDGRRHYAGDPWTVAWGTQQWTYRVQGVRARPTLNA